jgi:hypothetical protein
MILGLIAGIVLILSSAAHSLLGWPQVRTELAAANVPADLAFGLKAGWLFGGVAMLALGIITTAFFAGRLRGDAVSSLVPGVIAAVYVVFGGWALVANGFNPFFLVFVVPGILIALAASARRPAA